MKSIGPANKRERENPSRFSWKWIVIISCLLILLVIVLLPRPDATNTERAAGTNGPFEANTESAKGARTISPRRPANSATAHLLAPTAEEIVARKLIQFGKNRRELVHALAKRAKVDVPEDVERFFRAVEGGRWEEIDAAHKALLLGQDLNLPRSADLHQIWRPIQETWGAAREAHNWPAQKLLDYGEAVLGSLRPGMIYAGPVLHDGRLYVATCNLEGPHARQPTLVVCIGER